MQQSPAASTRSARPRRWIAPTLGIGVASVIGIAACDSNATAPVVQPPGRAIPVTEVRRATWPTPGGERNSPSGGATVIGTVLPHDGSATPVALPGIFNYRTIVRATFSGSVARTWNIAGQDPAPSYGPAGPGGDGNGGIYLAGGGAGGGAVTSSSGNVPSVEMYLPMLGSYTVGRGGLGQPSHDNPACGPFSTEPFFDCITYSGTGGSMSYETIDVPITGSVSNQNPRTGQIVTFRVQPQLSEIGGLSVALNDIEWLFVADDPSDEQPENQWAPAQPTGCNGARQCDQFAVYSGTMMARGYSNGKMQETVVGHITIADELTVVAAPASGPAGYTSTATASKTDGSPIDVIYGWVFHPDSAPATYTSVPGCGERVNPCVFKPPTSGKIEIHTLIGNRTKQKRAHVTVVPPSVDLTLSKSQANVGDTIIVSTTVTGATNYSLTEYTFTASGGPILASRSAEEGKRLVPAPRLTKASLAPMGAARSTIASTLPACIGTVPVPTDCYIVAQQSGTLKVTASVEGLSLSDSEPFTVKYVPCPTDNADANNPEVRRFLMDQLNLSRANGFIERAGAGFRDNGTVPPSVLVNETTRPGATQCRSEIDLRVYEGQPLAFLWHTHGMVGGAVFTNCPTQEPGSRAWPEPSTQDYEAQEAHPTVPMFIMENEVLWIINPHTGTDELSRGIATVLYHHATCPNWAA